VHSERPETGLGKKICLPSILSAKWSLSSVTLAVFKISSAPRDSLVMAGCSLRPKWITDVFQAKKYPEESKASRKLYVPLLIDRDYLYRAKRSIFGTTYVTGVTQLSR
jgi:hypothetical protein